MKNYEAMFIVKPDLSEEGKKELFNQINDAVVKNQGSVSAGSVWAEKRKFLFPIKKQQEGLYYLLSFSALASAIGEIKRVYQLNEFILRVLITAVEG